MREFLADDADEGVGGECLGDTGGKLYAVDREGSSGWDLSLLSDVEDKGAQCLHFIFEQTGSTIGEEGAEGVAADEFGEIGCLMGSGGFDGAHLVETYGEAALGQLPGGFTSGETAAHDNKFGCIHRIGIDRKPMSLAWPAKEVKGCLRGEMEDLFVRGFA